MTIPRKPGSQVAPGQRPLYRDAPTATTHSKVPLHQVTEGRLYRVRDKDWAAVWAENLSFADAERLKEMLIGQHRSRTARVEDMEIPAPDWYAAQAAHTQAYAAPEQSLELGAGGAPSYAPADLPAAPTPPVDLELEQMRASAIRTSLDEASAAQRRAEQLAAMQGNKRPITMPPPFAARPTASPIPPVPPSRTVTLPLEPIARSPAVAAPAAKRSQPRTQPPRDKTVVHAPPRTAPPPRDKTVTSEIIRRATPLPPAEEPQPLMSPLKAAMLPDEFELPDDATVIGNDDLSDLMSGLGGGPSDEDLARAKAQADADEKARGR